VRKPLKREGVCAASLPTTMGITAGFLIQNALKKLLGFGSVSYYLGYNAMQDFFPRDKMRPNPECSNHWCRKRQLEYQERVENTPVVVVEAKEKKVEHTENDWGIEIVSNAESSEGPVKVDKKDEVVVDDGADLSDLMSQLKNLSK